MRNETSCFNAAESQRHAEQGMLFAANNNATLLEEAREIARTIARRVGEVTADDVQMELQRRGYGLKALGNAAGSLFKGREWEKIPGRVVKSARIHAHANELKVWKLKEPKGGRQ